MAQTKAPDNERTDAVLVTEYEADKAGVGTGEIKRQEVEPIPVELMKDTEVVISLSQETIAALADAIVLAAKRR